MLAAAGQENNVSLFFHSLFSSLSSLLFPFSGLLFSSHISLVCYFFPNQSGGKLMRSDKWSLVTCFSLQWRSFLFCFYLFSPDYYFLFPRDWLWLFSMWWLLFCFRRSVGFSLSGFPFHFFNFRVVLLPALSLFSYRQSGIIMNTKHV